MINWQQRYNEGDTPWDKGGPAPELANFLKNEPIAGRVLIPGCGHGHDVAPFLASPAEQIVGLDLAPTAVALAETTWAGNPRVSFICGDLFELLPGALKEGFDWVWEHTCYCAIDPAQRPDYARCVAACLKPAGHLLAVFYLNPWDPGEDQSQGPPFGTSREELDRIFSPYFNLAREWAPTAAYPGREGREWMRLLQKR